MEENALDQYDFVIIGAGVIGNAIARELLKYCRCGCTGERKKLRVAVLEKNLDVCGGTSGRNSGVLHAGFNNRPGSKMARLCVEGNRGFAKVAQELSVPWKRTGKVVVGYTGADQERIFSMIAQGRANGIRELEWIGKQELKKLAPYVEGMFAMYSPTTAILDPFQLTIGLAENAHKNGAEYFFDAKVLAMNRAGSGYILHTRQGDFRAEWVVNSAGIYADVIAKMAGIGDYTIHPCRGEYFILDKNMGEFLQIPAYPVPNPKAGGLGIHLTPTVDGNVMIGPSAEYLEPDEKGHLSVDHVETDREDYASTRAVMEMLLREGKKIFPYLKESSVIRSFTGIRPKLTGREQGGYADFVMEIRKDAPHFVNLVGMESPGLTACVPIAKEVVQMVREYVKLEANPDFDPMRRQKKRFREACLEEQKQYVLQNPDYGEIVCRCEQISKAELLEAMHNPLGVHTVTGIKYRCRAMMGRCQGGYCQARIVELLEQELGIRKEDIRYAQQDSYLFTGEARK